MANAKIMFKYPHEVQNGVENGDSERGKGMDGRKFDVRLTVAPVPDPVGIPVFSF